MTAATASTTDTKTPATTNSMTADVMLSHTMDDDITFERVRHMPRRTQFVSTHRKLSWQYDRDMKQHERDKRIVHVEMCRAKVAMTEKLSRLQDVKKQVVERRKSNAGETLQNRRFSASCLPDHTETARVIPGMTHSQSSTSFSAETPKPSSIELTKQHAETHLESLVKTGIHEATDAKSGIQISGKTERRVTLGAPAKSPSVEEDIVRRMSDFIGTSDLNLAARLQKSATNNSMKTSDQPQSQSKCGSGSGTKAKK